jgi:hypothetical protein
MRQALFSIGIVLGAIITIALNGEYIDRLQKDRNWIAASERAAILAAPEPALIADAYFSRSGGIPAACGTIHLASGQEKRYVFVGPETDVTIEGSVPGFGAAWSALCKKQK